MWSIDWPGTYGTRKVSKCGWPARQTGSIHQVGWKLQLTIAGGDQENINVCGWNWNPSQSGPTRITGSCVVLPAHQFHFHRAIDTSDQRLIGFLSGTLIAHAASCMDGMGNFGPEVVSVPRSPLPGPGACVPHTRPPGTSRTQNFHIRHPGYQSRWLRWLGTEYHRSSLDRITLWELGNDRPLLLVPASRGRIPMSRLPRFILRCVGLHNVT